MHINKAAWKLVCLCVSLVLIGQSNIGSAHETTYTIGILAKRGKEIAIQRWNPTIEYLNEQIDWAHFVLLPLSFREIEPALQHKKINFLLANSGIYINAEHAFGAFRIATLVSSLNNGQTQYQFGGVIFTRKDNPIIHHLNDLPGKHFAAVNPTSLGGYLMARLTLKKRGIETENDFSMRFLNTHDAVVMAVLNKQVDAGTVRSDTLERMAADGLIDLSLIRVLNPQEVPGFEYRLSTPLYPEWPIAALPHTPQRLGKQVSKALLDLKADHPAALKSRIHGWTVPANYQPVHELYEALNLPPHRRQPPSLQAWIQHHPIAAILSLVSLSVILTSLLVLTGYNRRLKKTQRHLSQAINQEKKTAQKLEENLSKLRQSEETFSKLTEAAIDAIIMLNPQGKVVFWNTAAINIFGYTFEEVQDLSLEKWLLTPSSDTETYNPASEVIRRSIENINRPLPGSTLELTSIRKSGEHFPTEVATSSVKLNQSWHAIYLIRDITQRKKMQAEQQHLEQQLNQHHKMAALAQLTNGIAHEINTPIQTIVNNLRFLNEAFEDYQTLIYKQQELVEIIKTLPQFSAEVTACEKAREEIDLPFLDKEINLTLKQSCQGVEQVSQLVQSMKIFVIPDNPNPEQYDLNRLIQDVVAVSRHHWHPIANLVTELDNNLPTVRCFPGELHQALLNLLMNAVQAIQEKPSETFGEIKITSCLLDKDTIEITISDTGKGIPQEAKAHIFNPFFTTRDVGQGSGQGLTLAHNIVVQKHGGTLSFKSQINHGTTFRLQLPIK
jgi:two-component system sensor histidine kinase TtrS